MPTTKPRISITVDADDLAVLDRYATASGTPRASMIGALIKAVCPELQRAAELMELANAAPRKVVQDVVDNLSNATADAMGFLEPFHGDFRRVMDQLDATMARVDKDSRGSARDAAAARPGRPSASSPSDRNRGPSDPHLLTGGSK